MPASRMAGGGWGSAAAAHRALSAVPAEPRLAALVGRAVPVGPASAAREGSNVMSKLTLLHINIIGVIVALLLAGILWYMLDQAQK